MKWVIGTHYSILINSYLRTWCLFIQDYIPTVCFYDVYEGEESSDSDGSYSNTREADFVVFLIETLIASGVDPANIGVITLYKAQMFQIIAKLGTSR